MVGATASPLADGLNPLGDESRMNADLVDALAQSRDNDVHPVIFQLNTPVTQQDLSTMQSLGLEVLGDAPLVNGGLVEGTSQAVRHFSSWDRVAYLELDKPLDFFYPSTF
jgi:hypothetical protein